MEKDVPIVVVKEVGKSYGTVEALKEVSFVVERGEIFGLIGPDGTSGKKTIFAVHKDNPCRAIRESCKKNTGVN